MAATCGLVHLTVNFTVHRYRRVLVFGMTNCTVSVHKVSPYTVRDFKVQFTKGFVCKIHIFRLQDQHNTVSG